MADDLSFRVMADDAELKNFLDSIGVLKTRFVELEDVNKTLNSGMRSLTGTVNVVSQGLTSLSTQAKQLHNDLGYVIGDIEKIGLVGERNLLGDISNVGVGSPIGHRPGELLASDPTMQFRHLSQLPRPTAPPDYGLSSLAMRGDYNIPTDAGFKLDDLDIDDRNIELSRFLQTLQDVNEQMRNLPVENWLDAKRNIEGADDSLEMFLRDLEAVNREHAKSGSTNAQWAGADAFTFRNRGQQAAPTPSVRNNLLMGSGGFDPLDLSNAYDHLTHSQRRAAISSGDTSRSLAHTQMEGRKATLAIVELSRGFEDAAVTFGTGGLSGALRASINNFSQFAFILHPMAGAVAGVAGALTAALVPALLSTSDEAAKTTVELRNLLFTAQDFQRLSQGFLGQRAPKFSPFDPGLTADERRYGGEAGSALTSAQSQVKGFEDNLEGIRLNAQSREAARARLAQTSVEAPGLKEKDVQAFIDIARARQTQLGETTGQEALNVFEVSRYREHPGGLAPEEKKYLAEILKKLQEAYAEELDEVKKTADIQKEMNKATEEVAKRRKELAETVARERREAADFADMVTRTERMDREDERKERARERLTGVVQNLADLGSPEVRFNRELQEQLKTIQNTAENAGERDFLTDAVRGSAGIRRRQRTRQREIDEQIEELQGHDPFQSIAGKITGLDELNRRITEAAASVKDPTAEHLKYLREERKEADKEAKAELEKINATLEASLKEHVKREIGLIGP